MTNQDSLVHAFEIHNRYCIGKNIEPMELSEFIKIHRPLLLSSIIGGKSDHTYIVPVTNPLIYIDFQNKQINEIYLCILQLGFEVTWHENYLSYEPEYLSIQKSVYKTKKYTYEFEIDIEKVGQKIIKTLYFYPIDGTKLSRYDFGYEEEQEIRLSTFKFFKIFYDSGWGCTDGNHYDSFKSLMESCRDWDNGVELRKNLGSTHIKLQHYDTNNIRLIITEANEVTTL